MSYDKQQKKQTKIIMTLPWIRMAYLLAKEFWQNAGSFKLDIFKLRNLLRYIPLQSKRQKMLAASHLLSFLTTLNADSSFLS